MKAKKTDYVPEAITIGDLNTRKFGADLVVALQKVQRDTHDDLTELFTAVVPNISFYQVDVAANQTAVALNATGLSSNTEMVMFKPGQVMGISIASNDARTAGTLTVDVTINGTVQSVQAVLDGTNTTYHYSSVDRGAKKFVAGDRVGVKITTTGAWAPITADIVVMVYVAF